LSIRKRSVGAIISKEWTKALTVWEIKFIKKVKKNAVLSRKLTILAILRFLLISRTSSPSNRSSLTYTPKGEKLTLSFSSLRKKLKSRKNPIFLINRKKSSKIWFKTAPEGQILLKGFIILRWKNKRKINQIKAFLQKSPQKNNLSPQKF
jgi:hypothetical protein